MFRIRDRLPQAATPTASLVTVQPLAAPILNKIIMIIKNNNQLKNILLLHS